MKIEAKNKNSNLIKLGGFFIHKTAFRLSSYEETLEMATSHNMQLLTEEAFRNNIINEGGVNKTVRVLKMIPGLWILQQLRKNFSERN